MSRIDMFKDGYDFLSNFHEKQMWYKNILWESSEHAYQAEKSTDEDEREDIRCAATPGEAKRMCKPGKLKFFRSDWDTVKTQIMEDIVRAKFEDPDLRKQLLDTKDFELIEGNWWHDNYWGNCTCGRPSCAKVGENHLGKILMKVRNDIRNSGQRNETGSGGHPETMV